MKLPSKYIALLVVLSLAGIFVYQAYWLTGLYRTMRADLERNITEAMRISDYNEMLVRIELMQRRNKEHGEISVTAGYGDEGEKIVQSNTTFHTSPGDTTTAMKGRKSCRATRPSTPLPATRPPTRGWTPSTNRHPPTPPCPTP